MLLLSPHLLHPVHTLQAGEVLRLKQRNNEKIQEKMKEAAKLHTGLTKQLSDIAKEAALEHHFATFEGKPGGGLKYKLGKKVVMSKVAKALGFERTRGFYSSAAPLSEDVFR